MVAPREARPRGAGASALALSLTLHAGMAVGAAGILQHGDARAEWRGADDAGCAVSLALRLDPEVDLVEVPEPVSPAEKPPDLLRREDDLGPGEVAPLPTDGPLGIGARPRPSPDMPPDELRWRELARRMPGPPREVATAVPAPPPDTNDAAAAAHPARDGGNVAASVLPGHNEPPRYPFVAWRRHREGTVVLELDIDALGVVVAVRLVGSSGCEALDEAARAQLATWRFRPARGPLGAVASTVRQEVVFRIRQ